ncbi:MAG TPA: hypothetical protein PLI31_07000, partial [Methanoregulaceae archaeon]|nr:hypothetical protein [Methanoregulaceae archaeon]
MTIFRRHAIICLFALLSIAGCTGTGPSFGDLEYRDSELSVTVSSDAPIDHAALQVTIDCLEPLGQRQVFSDARYVNITAGTNRFTYPVTLAPGTYRCYLHLHEGDERLAAVIR